MSFVEHCLPSGSVSCISTMSWNNILLTLSNPSLSHWNQFLSISIELCQYLLRRLVPNLSISGWWILSFASSVESKSSFQFVEDNIFSSSQPVLWDMGATSLILVRGWWWQGIQIVAGDCLLDLPMHTNLKSLTLDGQRDVLFDIKSTSSYLLSFYSGLHLVCEVLPLPQVRFA